MVYSHIGTLQMARSVVFRMPTENTLFPKENTYIPVGTQVDVLGKKSFDDVEQTSLS